MTSKIAVPMDNSGKFLAVICDERPFWERQSLGELTIQGTPSDNGESNCQVYTDVNDITPLQNATAAGANGGEDDYSRWTYIHRRLSTNYRGGK
jgi:hypothetical protein